MHLSKEIWLSIAASELAKDRLPLLPCPTCHRTSLTIFDDSIRLVPKRQQDMSDFPKLTPGQDVKLLDAISVISQSITAAMTERYRFTAMFVCDSCGDSICCIGDAKSVGKERRPLYMRLRGFLPDLQIFELKHAYPDPVRQELAKSFSAFLSDPTAAGSRVRTAVEKLLDALNVPRQRIKENGLPKKNQEGKALKLSLGERLKQLEEKDAHSAQILGGIKQLGNEATHGSELPYADLLEAYDLMHHVLEELYSERPKRANKLQMSDHMSKKYR